MRYSEELIDEVRSRNDIVEVISGYIQLKKSGANYFGLCPFHGEKTPSFSVSPEKQMYHCFGCGASGNVFSFLMQYEQLSFPEAVQRLADRAGIALPKRELTGKAKEEADLRQKLFEVNKLAANYFYIQLKSPKGGQGLSYFTGRALTDATIRHFGLGYSNKTSDDLYRFLRGRGYADAVLKETGLFTYTEKGVFDKFWNRVMFPIMDANSRVIGFGGRVMGDGKPKYLNSPDTPVFNKSRNLFALNLANNTKLGRIVLTEGYMDTISLYQAGFDCAVASLGTSLTADHAKLLSRFTKEVVICYDSDQAGVQAADRAIPLLEKTGLKVRVLRVTGAKDPDEYIKTYGPEAFGRLLDRSENYMEYNLDQLESKYDLNDPVQKAEYARAAAEMLARLDSPVEQEVFAAQVSQRTGVGKDAVLQEIKQARNRSLRAAKRKQDRRDLTPLNQIQPRDRQLRYDNPRSARAEEGILRLLMMDATLIGELTGLEPEDFSSSHLGHIYDVLRSRLTAGRSAQLGALEGELTPEETSLLAEILRQPANLAGAAQALADYRAVMAREKWKGQADVDEATLLAARDTIRKKNQIGDGTP